MDLKTTIDFTKVKDITADSRRMNSTSICFLLPRAKKYAEVFFNKIDSCLALVHGIKKFKDQGLYVENIEESYTQVLQYFYRESFNNLKIYGVTGTNGKTTTAYMIKNLLESYSVPTGIFGTVENRFQDSILNTGLTTSTAEDFYRFNHQNYKKGMRAVVCEVSSHALDQKRLGLKFLNRGVFTSFSQDHLDYHTTMEAYLKAKMKMYTEALREEKKILAPKTLKSILSKEDYFTYKDSLKILEKNDKGLKVEFKKGESTLKGLMPLIGDYNAVNFMLALEILCDHFGESFFPDNRIFTSFKQVPGRMERIKLSSQSAAFVDYSHTPDSLEKALKTLSSFSDKKKIIVVFGCGGDRDKTKRKIMGQIAQKYGDLVVVTSDNPRTEDPLKIIKDIMEGAPKACLEESRKKAILFALEKSQEKASYVLIAGKGHETYQEINGVKHPFSDQEVIKEWLQKKVEE